MNIEITEELKQALAAQGYELKPVEKKPLRWQGKEGDTVFFVTAASEVQYLSAEYVNKNLSDSSNYFREKETAEQLAKAHKATNFIAAFVEQFDDGWEADWNDVLQPKWFAVYCNVYRKWVLEHNRTSKNPSIIYMSKQCAEALCDALNSGKYSLG